MILSDVNLGVAPLVAAAIQAGVALAPALMASSSQGQDVVTRFQHELAAEEKASRRRTALIVGGSGLALIGLVVGAYFLFRRPR